MDRAAAASRVKAWTRNRFGDVTVLVTELESAVPGFPPLHTVVAAWYKEALAVTPGVDCGCC